MRRTRTDLLATNSDANIFSGAPSFSLRNRAIRALWMLTWALLASWTPPPMHRWRVALLRLFGASVGPGCRIYRDTTVWYPPNLEMEDHAVLGRGVEVYNQGRIVIKSHAIISQRAFLCTGTHDIRDPAFQLVTRPIEIGARAWIAAEAFVGPGVTVGEGAVLAARATAFGDLAAWTVYRGNPSVAIKERKFVAAPR